MKKYSKLISKEQRNNAWGFYSKLNKIMRLSFEDFIKMNINNVKVFNN
jgi:hypothetical protein